MTASWVVPAALHPLGHHGSQPVGAHHQAGPESTGCADIRRLDQMIDAVRDELIGFLGPR